MKSESPEIERKGYRWLSETSFTGDGSFVILKVSGKERKRIRERERELKLKRGKKKIMITC